MSSLIGQPIDRVDGRLKTTGTARYSAEFQVKNLAHAVTMQSTITNGDIRRIDTSKAEGSPGVLAVFTYKNAPRLKKPAAKSSFKLGEEHLLPLQENRVYYNGQHIAMVVAQTFEQAEYAATLIDVEYNEYPAKFDLNQPPIHTYEPKASMSRPLQIKRGDVESAWRDAPVKSDQVYTTPVYNHNPMEPHATIAIWSGGRFTVYDSTQSVLGNRDAVAETLGISPKNVRLISLFVGGGFGCKGFTWPQTLLAPMAARQLGRPIKLVLNRQQMFTCVGRRAQTVQRVALGADNDGRLTAIEHEVLADTSYVDEFVETAGLPTQRLYACPNLRISHKLAQLNRGTPTPMRAPGEATGTFGIESAMDELSYQLKMDPVELRLRNYAEKDPQTGNPWSLKDLRECYRRGAAAIGWEKRNPMPQSMKEGNQLAGYGMATAIYPANRVPASAKVRIFSDGHAVASSCTQDIGTGTYTIMTQIAAQALGIDISQVDFKLGDSSLPKAPGSGGSQTAASVGPAVEEAARAARDKVLHLAIGDKNSPLSGQAQENITVANGRCFVKDTPSTGETYAEILRRNRMDFIDGEVATKGSTRTGANKQEKPKESKEPENIDLDLDPSNYSYQSFGAQFARVLFDPVLATVRVTHCATVMDIGQVLNLKTATNQIMGGMIFGIGMALMEETIYDPGGGRIITRDLANYLVPVHADMPEFDVQFIDRPDPHITSVGARGIGEIGITGMAAAVANAVYHASGKRIRDLPITPDKLI
jgi:xanthine dehydrogenase YagR molybdenum-binding subunit